MTSSFTVSQMTVNDIVGNYKFIYVDDDNKRVNATAQIILNGSDLSLAVTTKLLGSDMTLTFPAQFDQATGSIALQAGAKIYNQKLKLSTSSGQQVEGYMISAFEFAGDYLTYKNTVYGLMTFGYSNTYSTYAQLGKMKFPQNLGDYDVESLLIYFAKTEYPSSSDEVFGRIDSWKNCILIKTTAASPAKPAFLLPVATKATSSQPRFKSLAGYTIKK